MCTEEIKCIKHRELYDNLYDSVSQMCDQWVWLNCLQHSVALVPPIECRNCSRLTCCHSATPPNDTLQASKVLHYSRRTYPADIVMPTEHVYHQTSECVIWYDSQIWQWKQLVAVATFIWQMPSHPKNMSLTFHVKGCWVLAVSGMWSPCLGCVYKTGWMSVCFVYKFVGSDRHLSVHSFCRQYITADARPMGCFKCGQL